MALDTALSCIVMVAMDGAHNKVALGRAAGRRHLEAHWAARR